MKKLTLITVLIGGVGFWKYRGNCIQISIDKIRSLSPEWKKPGKYWETSKYHTPNLHKGRNEIKAIVLHHTH